MSTILIQRQEDERLLKVQQVLSTSNPGVFQWSNITLCDSLYWPQLIENTLHIPPDIELFFYLKAFLIVKEGCIKTNEVQLLDHSLFALPGDTQAHK